MLLGLEGGTESWSSSRNSGRGIALGDRVVRGPSWDWGASQDGGPGGYGTVVDVRGLTQNVPYLSPTAARGVDKFDLTRETATETQTMHLTEHLAVRNAASFLFPAATPSTPVTPSPSRSV